MKFVFPILMFCLFTYHYAWATHNRGGEITYKQIGLFEIEATLITYTNLCGQLVNADRTEMEIDWGDGTSSIMPRDSFQDIANSSYRKNYYSATHVYNLGPFGVLLPQNFSLLVQDPNRSADILNINGGNSSGVEFAITTEVYLFTNFINDLNSSNRSLNEMDDIAKLGTVYEYTPASCDLDGDSITYELITPIYDLNSPISGYQSVDLISPGSNNNYTFNSETGLFRWNAPQQEGSYNLAIAAKSYRDGNYMGMVVNDIEIEVVDISGKSLDLVGPAVQKVRVGPSYMDTIRQSYYIISSDTAATTIEILAPDFIKSRIQTNLTQISTDSQKLDIEYAANYLDPGSNVWEHDYYSHFTVKASIREDNIPIVDCPTIDTRAYYHTTPIVYYSSLLSNLDPVENLGARLLQNPVDDLLRIELPTLAKDFNIQIFDLNGILLYEEIAFNNPNWQKSIGSWPASIYIIKLETDQGEQILKFIKK